MDYFPCPIVQNWFIDKGLSNSAVVSSDKPLLAQKLAALSAAELPILHQKNNLKTISWVLGFWLLSSFTFMSEVKPGSAGRCRWRKWTPSPPGDRLQNNKGLLLVRIKITRLIFYIYDQFRFTDEHYSCETILFYLAFNLNLKLPYCLTWADWFFLSNESLKWRSLCLPALFPVKPVDLAEAAGPPPRRAQMTRYPW